MDLTIFATSAAVATYWWQHQQQSRENNNNNNNNKRKRTTEDKEEKEEPSRICYVTAENELLKTTDLLTNDNKWCRATYVLIMHEPPHLFYEPKEWSHTSVLLLQKNRSLPNTNSDNNNNNVVLELPGGVVCQGENYQDSAVRRLQQDTHVDVCQPENCLHHLFTFPWNDNDNNNNEASSESTDNTTTLLKHLNVSGIWGDFYECIFRGKFEDLGSSMCSLSLVELQQRLEQDESQFVPDTCYALKLYFQRQGDLRAQRRLYKGYSSLDLEHYGLRDNNIRPPVLTLDSFQDNSKQEAVEFTMTCDDGMNSNRLYEADIVILGVSRTGKTPLSIYISQTTGLKVANVPMVLELTPPQELTAEGDGGARIIDPRRVFCLTRHASEMEKLRTTRIEQALQKSRYKQESTYADMRYIRRDLNRARNYARENGFTEIDVTDRALEESASIIVSKMKERFPDMHIHA